jgi:DNA repair exonuclease SbcCD ATPase subunit/predicted phosphodiesterase
MKLLITGDWQLEAAPAHDQVDPATNRSIRFAENVATISQALEAGLSAGAEGLLHLGDLTENKNPKAVELEAAADLFNVFLKAGKRVWAVAGNHDGSLFDISSSSFAPLAAMRSDAFKLFHKVSFDKELGMVAVPYMHRATPDELTAMITQATAGLGNAPKFAAIHYGVTGCTVGARNLVLQTDYLGKEQFAEVTYLDHIFAGHIHKGQTVDLGNGITGYLPGSPLCCDMGEREDSKTVLLFDTVTRKVEVRPVAQPRRWVVVEYRAGIGAAPYGKPIPWDASDIVKITGTYEKPDYPKDTLEAAFKAGLPRPFSLEIAVTQAKAARALRSMDITAEGGLREAAKNYAREKFPSGAERPGQLEPAVDLVLDVLTEQGVQAFAPNVAPIALTISDFLTFKTYSGPFNPGMPVLITGKNGIGKTNFFEAILWCMTGQTSKGLSLAGVVRQGAQEAGVAMTFVALASDQAATKYRINRSVKLSKAGKPAQKLNLHKETTEGQWESLSDGGVAEVQVIINSLLGGSYNSLRTTNFKFQNDQSPFIKAHPTERKAIIGEITGLEPLSRAFKVLDEKRKASQRAHEDLTARLGGMLAANEGATERLQATEVALTAAVGQVAFQEGILPGARAAVDQADAAAQQARVAVEAAETVLNALPNTEATLQAAQQALLTHDAAYTTARAAKATRWTQLQAQIKEAEGKLAALKAPDPAELAALEKAELAAKADYDQAQAAYTRAQGDQRAAETVSEGARQAVKTASEALVKARTELSGLAPAADVAALEKALTEAEALVAQADAQVAPLAGEAGTIRAGVLALTSSQEALRTERAAFDGQDVGTCSKCGHPIDSAHIEQELARIDAALVKAAQELAALNARAEVVQAELGKQALAKIQAQGAATTARQALEAGRLLEAKRATLTQAVAEGEGRVAQTQTAADAASSNAFQALEKATALCGVAVKLEGVHQALVVELRAKQGAGAEIGRLQGQLQALRDQHAENEKAGIEEKAAHEKEAGRLALALAEAQAVHAAAELQAQAQRQQLAALREAWSAKTDALVAAKAALQQVVSALALAKERQADLAATIQAIKDQQQALSTTTFELATLKERAEIDAAAASLLDPKAGLPVYLIDQALPFLEDRINYYLSELGMDRLLVELTTLEEDKETLAILVDNGRPGPKLDIAAFSGGQLGRIEQAIKWALEDLRRQSRGVTLGLSCSDEPTDGLDEDGKAAFIRIIYQRAETYPVSLVVSHDEHLTRSFESRMQFSQGPMDETLVA